MKTGEGLRSNFSRFIKMAPSLLQIVLVGDSDISRWPEALLPTAFSSNGDHAPQISISGHGGSTLKQVVPYVRDSLTKIQDERRKARVLGRHSQETTVLVVCAGENDIGSGIPLFKSEESLKALLGIIFGVSKSSSSEDSMYLIFLGPKFEPWLTDDLDARKSYVQMSRSFERLCSDFGNSDAFLRLHRNQSIVFVDCLTMFCGESAKQPGALLGGKAIPEKRYFNDDQLHLSDEGYALWKSILEEKILEILIV